MTTNGKRSPIPAELRPDQVVALVETREQTPLDLSPLQAITGTLATGDYSIRGLEHVIAHLSAGRSSLVRRIFRLVARREMCANEVLCQECGRFLLNSSDLGQQPPSQQFRRTGEMTAYELDYFDATPICERGLMAFAWEPEELLEQLKAPRKCEVFIQQRPGFGPKEYSLVDLFTVLERDLRDKIQKQLDDAERGLRQRHHASLVVQFLLACLAGVVCLVGAKLLPWF